MIWALHLANILILCSFLVRDMLLLRLLSIAAGFSFCFFFYADNKTEPIIWNLLFIIVNFSQIGLMMFQRRKIPLCPIGQFVYEHVFPSLQPSEIKDLISISQRLEPHKDFSFKGLGLVVKGTIHHQGKMIRRGSFLGIYPFLKNKDDNIEGTQEASSSCVVWPNDHLRKWIEKSPNRHNLLLRALSNDLLHTMETQ